MASKGENKTQKLLSASQVLGFERKKKHWVIRTKAGAHAKEDSLPLGVVIRDRLQFASNLKETKKILNSKLIKVNGKIRTDPQFAVGLMDLIDVALEKNPQRFLMLLDSKGRCLLKENKTEKKVEKLSKIVGKNITHKGKINIRTHDGHTLEVTEKIQVGDTIKWNVLENKILEIFKLQKGSLAFIEGGTHTGQVARIQSIVPGTMKRSALVHLDIDNGSFQTIKEYVFVIGNQKPEIEI